ASAESIGEFVFEETAQHAPALSAGAFVRLNHAPQLPRETRFARPGDRRAAKHRRLRSLRAKVARRFRHYSVEGRCACNSASWGKRCDGPPTLAHRSFSPSAPRSGTEKSQLLRPNVN